MLSAHYSYALQPRAAAHVDASGRDSRFMQNRLVARRRRLILKSRLCLSGGPRFRLGRKGTTAGPRPTPIATPPHGQRSVRWGPRFVAIFAQGKLSSPFGPEAGQTPLRRKSLPVSVAPTGLEGSIGGLSQGCPFPFDYAQGQGCPGLFSLLPPGAGRRGSANVIFIRF